MRAEGSHPSLHAGAAEPQVRVAVHPAAAGAQITGLKVAVRFLGAHPEYEWARGLLIDMPTQPWTEFWAGMKAPETR